MRRAGTLVVAAAGVVVVGLIVSLWPSSRGTAVTPLQDPDSVDGFGEGNQNEAMSPDRTPALLDLSAGPAAGFPGNPGLSIALDGLRTISLTVNEEFGLPMAEFVKLAAQISEKVIVYRAGDARTEPTVRLDGTVQLRGTQFFSFFRAVLCTMGYRCSTPPRGEPGTVEVVAMDPEDRSSGVGEALLRFVPYDELQALRGKDDAKDRGKTNDTLILTAIPLVHSDGAELRVQLERYFANLDSGIKIWSAASLDTREDLILWGTASDISKAMGLIARIDLSTKK